MNPGPLRRQAPAIALHALCGVVPAEALRRMVGAGPGTTPSGDDIIVGVLAALNSLGLRENAAALSRQVAPLLSTTTVASRHYLKAAARGRFGEHVHQILDSLAAGAPAERTIGEAGRWGATSGVDLLIGLVSTLATFVNNRSSESAA
jgi:hypothetical protein